MNNLTNQELFWKGDFGNNYIYRNKDEKLLASNLSFFSRALKKTNNLNTIIEFGANIGMNLKALKSLLPEREFFAIEINKNAHTLLSDLIGKENAYHKSLFDFSVDKIYDLSFIKGVLIHKNPDKLNVVYEKLYNSSNKYILFAEYYNPTPMTIPYTGHDDKIFKLDFAGEMLDKYEDLSLIDYGFVYHRDAHFPQDDITWFLLEKK